MVDAVLPLMRRQKHGHIVNAGSLSGLSSIPFLGIYSATKFALEGYTEALRHELKPFNIHVSLTEAGFLKTPMMNNRQIAAESDRRVRAMAAAGARCHSWPGREGALPDRTASQVRRPLAAISPGRPVRTGRAAYLRPGQSMIRSCIYGTFQEGYLPPSAGADRVDPVSA
jgi:NAD(P)-dependent dehydrogenase (short-subunit alcohol dehydrogenase family)